MDGLCCIFDALYILLLLANYFLDYRLGSSVMAQLHSAGQNTAVINT
jgi:hypothetical protein